MSCGFPLFLITSMVPASSDLCQSALCQKFLRHDLQVASDQSSKHDVAPFLRGRKVEKSLVSSLAEKTTVTAMGGREVGGKIKGHIVPFRTKDTKRNLGPNFHNGSMTLCLL